MQAIDRVTGGKIDVGVGSRILYTAVLMSGAERVLEIGVRAGGSTSYLAAALEDGAGGKLVSVDNWTMSKPEENVGIVDGPAKAIKRLKKYGLENRVEIVTADSLDYMRACKRGDFDFIYVDGDHHYDAQLQDIKEAWRIASIGIAVHDPAHDSCGPDVRRAIKDAGVRGVIVPVGNGCFFARKR